MIVVGVNGLRKSRKAGLLDGASVVVRDRESDP